MATPKRRSMGSFRKLRYSLEFLLLAFFNLVLFVLPWSLSWRLGRGLGWLSYHLFTKRKVTVERNIRRAFPDLSSKESESIIKGCYLHWGEGFISTLKLWMVSDRKARSIIDAPGFEEYVLKAQKANEPILYFTGHFGSWEMAGRFAGGIGPGASSIYHIQKNPMVNWFLTWVREFHHLKLINSRSGMPAFEDALKRYTGMAVVGDQYRAKRALTVYFFGIPSLTPKGAAILTYRVQPRLVFLACTQHRGHYKMKFEEIPYSLPNTLDDDWMTELTQNLTSKLEAEIRKYPEQYFWFHRRWRDLDILEKKVSQNG